MYKHLHCSTHRWHHTLLQRPPAAEQLRWAATATAAATKRPKLEAQAQSMKSSSGGTKRDTAQAIRAHSEVGIWAPFIPVVVPYALTPMHKTPLGRHCHRHGSSTRSNHHTHAHHPVANAADEAASLVQRPQTATVAFIPNLTRLSKPPTALQTTVCKDCHAECSQAVQTACNTGHWGTGCFSSVPTQENSVSHS